MDSIFSHHLYAYNIIFIPVCLILLDTKIKKFKIGIVERISKFSHVHDIKCKDVHIVSSMARNSNSDICENENEVQPTSSQWTQITGHPVDRIMGKSILLTHKAENLEIDIPRARELGRGELGGAEWTIIGRIIIATETHDSRGDA